MDIKTFLEENQIQASRTEDNLYYTIEEAGEGEHPQAGQYVKVHYTGTFLDGKKFDSSVDRGEPFIFPLGQGRVIKGWEVAIPLLKIGGKGTFYIPHTLGYGPEGAGGGVIPPFASLKFEVELLGTMTKEEYEKDQETLLARRREEYLRQALAQLQRDSETIEAYAIDKQWVTQRTNTGLTYMISREGTGPKPQKGQTVAVHYEGRLLSGQVFDSSHQRNQPIAFPIGEGKVIPGWDEGIALFNEGGKGTLIIPSPLAYGPRAMGPIPANSILIFDIELVTVG